LRYPGDEVHEIIRTMHAPSPDAKSSEVIAPHPLLTKYYADEPGRKRRVNELFDVSAPHYDWITDTMSFGTSYL
jgi:hypothetical protein